MIWLGSANVKHSNHISFMSTTLAKVHHADQFINPELRAIAHHARKSKLTSWYRVRFSGEEVAFLAVERFGKRFVLNQMVVPRELRDLGVGSAALRAVEDLAQSEGFGTVRVWPRPLDNSFDQEGLERWYRERGYKTVPDGTGDREKRIIPVSPDNNFRSFCELNRGFRVISTEWTDYSRKVFQNSTKALENVVGAKSVEDAIEVQTKYAKEAYEAHTAELKKLGEMYASLMQTAFKMQAH
jgi:GNAT superfamily N-acetyltransferase